MKKRFFSLVLVLAMLAALCGCGGGTETAGTVDSSKSESESAQTESAEQTQESTDSTDGPVYGGSITVGITQDLDSLDPHKAVAAGTKEVLYNLFEGLVKPNSEGEHVPAIAKSYTISDDALHYSFELRDNVKFHNGKTLTVDDVIYSLKRCAGMLETSDPEVQVISALSVISEITATENGVELTLSTPNTELIGYLTCAIVPCDYENQSTAPVGTGPFKFVSYTPQTSVILEKNEDYYVEGVPYLDGVTFKIEASADAAFLELLGGSIDIFPYLTTEQADQLGSDIKVLSAPMNLVQALFLNNAVKPFDDIRVRQAICYALDRQTLIDMTMGGQGDIVESAIFSSYGQIYNTELSETYTQDIEKAKALLTEAGYPDGFTFTIKVPSNYTFHVNTAQILVEQLKAIGVNAEIELIEWASWLSDVYAGRDFEGTVVGLDSKLAPADTLRFYPSDASRNFINYSSAEFDELYSKAINEVDMTKKAEAYRELQRILTMDAASAFIQSPYNVVAVSSKLDGYTFCPIYVQDMSTVYFVGK